MTELEAYKTQLVTAARHIETLLPFARARMKESGDVAGMVENAQAWLCLPIVVKTRVEQRGE